MGKFWIAFLIASPCDGSLSYTQNLIVEWQYWLYEKPFNNPSKLCAELLFQYLVRFCHKTFVKNMRYRLEQKIIFWCVFLVKKIVYLDTTQPAFCLPMAKYSHLNLKKCCIVKCPCYKIKYAYWLAYTSGQNVRCHFPFICFNRKGFNLKKHFGIHLNAFTNIKYSKTITGL